MTESTESVIPQTPAASTAAPERAEPALLADSESTATATPVAEVGVRPSACACGGGTAGAPPAALVYALGQIGYDFGSEARRDSLLQQSGRNVQDPGQWLACLKADPASAASVIWTLNLDATPVYAVVPAGPFAADGYLRLREFLESQLSEGAERVSVPGVLRGSIRLINGQLVPVIIPEVRGMYSWTTSALLQSVLGSTSKKREDAARQAAQGAAVQNFLERIYYEVRNLGVTSPDRAMNFAATNAFQVRTAFESALEGGFKLDRIEAERSVICRPGSDCWDVKLTFFHPSRRLEEARRMHRFTVDVSDVVPVTVGKPRQWEVY